MIDFCPERKDVCLRRGDSPVIRIQVKSRNSDGTAGTVIDVTGYSFRLTVDPSPEPEDDTNNLFSLTGVITDAASGEVEFQPSVSQTAANVGEFFYDIQMVTTTPSVRTVLWGTFEITQDISKTAP